MNNTAFIAFHNIYAFGSWHLNGCFVCLFVCFFGYKNMIIKSRYKPLRKCLTAM